jgi:hypothetical protein
MGRNVSTWQQWPVRRLALATVALAAAGLMSACSSPAAGTFQPAAESSAASDPAASAGQAGGAGSTAFLMPPFGSDVHVVMPAWLPDTSSQVPAVVADKNFLLAFLYAEYRGNRDHRWTRYASGTARRELAANLRQPGVTTESFTGTIRFSHMTAFPDPNRTGKIDVAACFDNSHSRDTNLATGKPLADHTSPDQHYYRSTDVLGADSQGRWHVVAVYPVLYYPQAKECKP